MNRQRWVYFQQGIKIYICTGVLALNLTGCKREFNIDYNHEDLCEVDSYEQQIIWKYKNIGLIKEGERPKAIIQRYIQEKKTNNLKNLMVLLIIIFI
ncbi:immunity protein YezG family protein [Neobacillus sp. LXY-4]|uniref:immunity protein YezG family protein n=1 Tax=Neobacillus sp. LXY-4 TaxID=3379826 RepID=UPI003EE24312